MTLTTHAAAGIVVAYWTQDPLLGFFAAVISHFILDMIPHGDEFIFWRLAHNPQDAFGRRIAIGDTSGTILILILTLLFKPQPNNELIVWGAIGGALPDLFMSFQAQLKYATLPGSHGTKRRIVEGIIKTIEPFQKVHGFCHDLIRTPIRLIQGYALQIIFIVWYVGFFLAA